MEQLLKTNTKIEDHDIFEKMSSLISLHDKDKIMLRIFVTFDCQAYFWDLVLVKNYCIHLNVFVLQAITSDSMDIPPEFISGKQYKASLAHKINHSFDPNCR